MEPLPFQTDFFDSLPPYRFRLFLGFRFDCGLLLSRSPETFLQQSGEICVVFRPVVPVHVSIFLVFRFVAFENVNLQQENHTHYYTHILTLLYTNNVIEFCLLNSGIHQQYRDSLRENRRAEVSQIPEGATMSRHDGHDTMMSMTAMTMMAMMA